MAFVRCNGGAGKNWFDNNKIYIVRNGQLNPDFALVGATYTEENGYLHVITAASPQTAGALNVSPGSVETPIKIYCSIENDYTANPVVLRCEVNGATQNAQAAAQLYFQTILLTIGAGNVNDIRLLTANGRTSFKLYDLWYDRS